MQTHRRTARVVKTLAPDDRGAIELSKTYGDALICVRHRVDARGKVRLVTVELLVNRQLIQPRKRALLWVRTAPHEKALHALIQTAGGRWDGERRLWRLSSRTVSILNLRDRVVNSK
jgi:hypothetical protein